MTQLDGDSMGMPRIVLHVEDDPQNVCLVATILSRRRPDITLVSAANVAAGLEMALEHQRALLLLDGNLPDTSGKNLLPRLRAQPQTAAIPVIVLSGDTDPPSPRPASGPRTKAPVRRWLPPD